MLLVKLTAGSVLATRSDTGFSGLAAGLAVSEAVEELVSGLAGLAELGLASTGLAVTSVAELGLATSDPATGLALASSGLRTFSSRCSRTSGLDSVRSNLALCEEG